jgi:hypothetical protein
LQKRLAAISTRMDQAYLDKLDGKITTEFWEHKNADWLQEEQQVQFTLDGLKQADEPARLLTASRTCGLRETLLYVWPGPLLPALPRKPSDVLRLSRPLPTDRLDQKWRAYICQNGSVFGLVHGTQVILVDGAAYSPAQPRACHLVESKMYSAVNARVGDVVGNLLKRGVLQDYAGYRGV